jgi:hypothetical protein
LLCSSDFFIVTCSDAVDDTQRAANSNARKKYALRAFAENALQHEYKEASFDIIYHKKHRFALHFVKFDHDASNSTMMLQIRP